MYVNKMEFALALCMVDQMIIRFLNEAMSVLWRLGMNESDLQEMINKQLEYLEYIKTHS